MNFEQMNLSNYILDALKDQGFDQATEIQSLAIPSIMAGNDVMGLSHTGSGKTYAFVIPALELIQADLANIQVLIICPTRELVLQTTDEIRKLTEHRTGIKTVPIFGGNSIDRQIQAIRKNAKIVVGTPGRLMDHLRRKTLQLHALKLLVLDEADEMLNMGFREDIETILQSVSTQHQTVMFSATMPQEIKSITRQYMNNPIIVQSKEQASAQTFIRQQYVKCGRDDKYDTLLHIVDKYNPNTAIVFCNTKAMTEQLKAKLDKDNVVALRLNGDMRQNDRRKVMDGFKSNGGLLIATDVAARGIDVKNVDIVVNYDIPANPDYYVHRIGRTARAGKEGLAITILNTSKQFYNLQDLMKLTGNKIEEIWLDTNSLPRAKKTNAKAYVKEDNYQSKKELLNELTNTKSVSDRTSEANSKPNRQPSKDRRAVESRDQSQQRGDVHQAQPKQVSSTDSIDVLIEGYLSQRARNKKQAKYLTNDDQQGNDRQARNSKSSYPSRGNGSTRRPSYRSDGFKSNFDQSEPKTADDQQGNDRQARNSKSSYPSRGNGSARRPSYRSDGFKSNFDQSEPKTADDRQGNDRQARNSKSSYPSRGNGSARHPSYRADGFKSNFDQSESKTADDRQGNDRQARNSKSSYPSRGNGSARRPSYRSDGFKSNFDQSEPKTAEGDSIVAIIDQYIAKQTRDQRKPNQQRRSSTSGPMQHNDRRQGKPAYNKRPGNKPK